MRPRVFVETMSALVFVIVFSLVGAAGCALIPEVAEAPVKLPFTPRIVDVKVMFQPDVDMKTPSVLVCVFDPRQVRLLCMTQDEAMWRAQFQR